MFPHVSHLLCVLRYYGFDVCFIISPALEGACGGDKYRLHVHRFLIDRASLTIPPMKRL